MQADPRPRHVVHELQEVAAIDVHERAMIRTLAVHLLGLDKSVSRSGLDAIHLAERRHRTGLAICEDLGYFLFCCQPDRTTESPM